MKLTRRHPWVQTTHSRVSRLTVLGVVVMAFMLAAVGLSFASDGLLAPADLPDSGSLTQLQPTLGGLPPEGGGELGSGEETGTAISVSVPETGTPDLGVEVADVVVQAAGSYSVHWAAADPKPNFGNYHPTYQKLDPDLMIGYTWPMTGQQADPLEDAVAYSPLTGVADYVQSLTPTDLQLGCIVPFELIVTVSGETATDGGAITLYPEFGAKTTSGADFGYDPDWGIIAAFVDTADEGLIDPGGDATVSFLDEELINPGTNNEATRGTITVSGLDDGDRAVVEIWVVLDEVLPLAATGNVQTDLSGAETGSILGAGDAINTGAETVPLLRVNSFTERAVDMSVVKSDVADPVTAGDRVHYVIVVTNEERPAPLTTWPANGVLVEDVRGDGLTWMPDSLVIEGDTHTPLIEWTEGRFRVMLGTLAPSQVVTLTVDAVVNDVAPQSANTTSTPDIPDRMNTVNVSSMNPEFSAANNIDIEYTGVVPADSPTISVSIEPTPDMLMEPGGEFLFTYVVTNTSETTVTLQSLYDTQLGYLPLPPSPVIIGPGQNSPSFEATKTYTMVGSYAHLVAAYAVDEWGQVAGAIDTTEVHVGAMPDYTDVSITKFDGFDPILANRLQAYFILASNESSHVAAQDVVVTDELPENMLFVPTTILVSGTSSPYTWTCIDNTLRVMIDEIGPLETVTVSYRAIVRPEDPMTANPGSLEDLHDRYNDAMISTETTENALQNNLEGEWSGVIPLAQQLVVNKTASPAFMDLPGGMFNYTVVVSNVSTNTLTLTEVYDDILGLLDLPADLVLSPGEDSAPILASGMHSEVGTFTNTVYALASHPGGFRVGAWDDATVMVVPEIADLSIEKLDGDDPVRGGTAQTYSIVVRNNSTESTATGVIVDDILGPDMSWVEGSEAITPPSSVSAFYSGQLATFTVPALGPSQTATITVDAMVDNVAPMTAHVGSPPDIHDRVNSVVISSDLLDPDLDNNSAVEFTGVMPIRNSAISVDKSVDPATMLSPGGVFTYTFVVSNVGSGTVTVTELSDTMLGDLDLPFDVVLAPGESMESVVATMAHMHVGVHTNIATVRALNDDLESVMATDSASAEVVQRMSDLSITKMDGTDPIRAGQTLTYTIVVHNSGPDSALNTVVTDTLDDGTTFVPGSVEVVGVMGATSDYDSGVLTVMLGDLAVDASTTITFDVTVDIEPPMSLSLGDEGNVPDRINAASVASDAMDPNQEDNLAIEMTGVMPPANPAIRVTKTASPSRLPKPGGTFTYTYLVSNVGSDTLTVTSLDDNIIGELDLPADVVLNAGESMETVVATWSATAVGRYTNVVTVVAQNREQTTIEATASATVEIYEKELPFTGGNAARWLIASAALIALGIGLRRRPKAHSSVQ